MKQGMSRLVTRAIMGACALAGAVGAQAAGARSVAYTAVDLSQPAAYIVDWNDKKHRAHVVELMGAADGTYTDDGRQRVVTFDQPISYEIATADCLSRPMSQRFDIQAAVFRPVSGSAAKGSSQVVDIFTITDIGGCTPGAVQSVGTPDDPGQATSHLDMRKRPPLDDLVPGARLAGPSETPTSPGHVSVTRIVQSVTTFGKGTLRFEDSGHVFPISKTDGWIVFDHGDFTRAYTRLSHDAKGGSEVWIQAAWNGAPATVMEFLMVQPNDAAGFGSPKAAAHHWGSGMFLLSPTTTAYDLYRDGSGQRVIHDVSTGDDDFQAVAWWQDSASLVTQRSQPGTDYFSRRTWEPLANIGKNHFVMEHEDDVEADGTFLTLRFAPRVNFYVDGGKAIPPAARVAAGHLGGSGRPEPLARP